MPPCHSLVSTRMVSQRCETMSSASRFLLLPAWSSNCPRRVARSVEVARWPPTHSRLFALLLPRPLVGFCGRRYRLGGGPRSRQAGAPRRRFSPCEWHASCRATPSRFSRHPFCFFGWKAGPDPVWALLLALARAAEAKKATAPSNRVCHPASTWRHLAQ